MNQPPEEGQILLIDKDLEWTSFDVVKKIRGMLKIKKVGHAGTLDPLATGLLIVCTGRKTKQINQLQDMEKEYTGTFTLGATTPSYDLETAIDQRFSLDTLTEEAIHSATSHFRGVVEQTPPIYSAIQIDGVRAYKHARAGKTVKMEPRNIFIRVFEITDISLPEVRFRVVCSKGTYIRTLASDFGKALGNGAHLSALRRTRIGEYDVKDALTIEQLKERVSEDL